MFPFGQMRVGRCLPTLWPLLSIPTSPMTSTLLLPNTRVKALPPRPKPHQRLPLPLWKLSQPRRKNLQHMLLCMPPTASNIKPRLSLWKVKLTVILQQWLFCLMWSAKVGRALNRSTIYLALGLLFLRWLEVAQNAFPSVFWSWSRQRHKQNYLREMEFAADVEGCMESWRGRVCLECQGRHILSEGSVSGGVLWHLPLLQGSDSLALLAMKWVERW